MHARQLSFFPQLFIEAFFHRSLIQTPTVAFISIHNQVIIYFCHPSIAFHCFSCLQCHGGYLRPYGEGTGAGGWGGVWDLTPCTSCQFIKWKHVSQFAWCDSRLQTGGGRTRREPQWFVTSRQKQKEHQQGGLKAITDCIIDTWMEKY